MAFRSACNKRITADIVPMEDMEDEDESSLAPLPKRNLMSDFGRPSVLEPPVPHEHMKVYLRIRPFTKDELDRNEDQGCLSVESDRMVVTNAPKESHFYKNMTRGLCRTTTKYRFSHVFNENTIQKDFFSSTMLGYVKDFIDGQNCLVFSYGVTSSGKTYTIQGNPKDAGILPRALDVLFNSINNRQWDGMDLKPKLFMDVTRLSPEQEQEEKKIKEFIMKLSCDTDLDVMSLLGDDASDVSTATNTTTCSESSNISVMKDSLDNNDMIFKELDDRVREEGKVSVEEQGQVKFSVWVSFAEIYNEQIYDLLVPVPKKKNARRPCLKLSEDKNGSPYIKGLKYIHVNSADEAYKLLTIGQRNLQTACTKLNHNSSRSHCIFNIKILRVIDKDNPQVARVSTLTLCDLAGSERYSKTQNSGDRLKEAGNINTSLLTLGRCIETLRYNQAHKDQSRIIPFRESKLTRLFQNFFGGQGKAAMIVNVNPLASMFDETMHVFKFSAIASKVEVHQKPVFIKPKLPVAPVPCLIPRTSISWATPARHSNLKQQDAENMPVPDDDDDDLEEEDDEQVYTQENIDELLGIIDQLQKDLKDEVESKWKMEKQIRSEVCEEMMRQFAEIEEDHSERLRIREQRAEELAEARFQIQLEAERAKHKDAGLVTDNEDEWVSSIFLHREKLKVEEKDEEIKELNETIKELKKEIEQLNAKDKELSEAKEKIKTLEQDLEKKGETKVIESGQADLIENLTQQLTQARQQIKDQEKEVGELNDMLTEAGETFEQKETEISKLKELTQEYERKMEAQSEAIAVLERAAADSKVAMETADQSLSKREDCVATLQSDIRDLEAEVNKYRNKARFFEEQIVEKEKESQHWKSKFENDVEDNARSQDALIHGFNAEISNLKSQIFHFKTQLYGVKSPTKSPGGSKKSPDVRMRLFPMSPLNTSARDLNSSTSSGSPRENKKNVDEQVNGLQCELDKNCAMIKELEHALQVSRSAVTDLEKKLEVEMGKHKDTDMSQKQVNEQDSLKESDTEHGKSDDSSKDGKEEKIEPCMNNQLSEKDKEIEELKEKIRELEPLMKDYFSTSQKLTNSEKKVKDLDEKLEDKVSQVIMFEVKVSQLEKSVSDNNEEINILKEKEVKLLEALASLKEKLSEEETWSEKLHDLEDEVREKEKELEGARDTADNQLGSIGKQVTTLKEQLIEREESFVKREQEMSDMKVELTEKLDSIEHEMQGLKANAKELEQQVGSLENELKLKESKHNALQTSYDELKESFEDESANARLSSAMLEIADLKSALHTHKTHHHKVKGELEEALLTMENMRYELEHYKKQAQSVKALDEELVGKTEKLACTAEELTSETEKLACTTSELAGKTEQLASMTDELASKTEQLASMTDELASKTEQLASTTDELETAEKVLGEMREVLKRRDEQLEELQNDLRNMNKNQKLSNKTKDETTVKLEEIEKELSEKKCVIDFLENEKHAQVQELEERLSEKETNIENLQKVNIEKVKELEKDNIEKVKELEERLSEKETDIENLQKVNIEKVKELENDNIEKVKELEERLSEKETDIENLQKVNIEKVKELEKDNIEKVKELEKDNIEKVKELEKVNIEKVKELEKDNIEKVKELEKDLSEKRNEVNKLQSEVNELQIEVNKLQSELNAKSEEQETSDHVQNNISELQKEVESKLGQINEHENQVDSLSSYINKICDLIGCEHVVNGNLLDSSLQNACDKIREMKQMKVDTEQKIGLLSSELDILRFEKSELDARLEKLSKENDDLRDQMHQKTNLNEASELNCFSPTTGVRKLRKEKIEVENSLVEARYKISTLESKIRDLELKLKNTSNEQRDVIMTVDPLPQIKLNNVSAKLQESETRNRALIKEVTQLQGDVERLENGLREEQLRHETPMEKDIHRRSRASLLQADPRQSISSPSTKMELSKSRDREHKLKEQLCEVNEKTQEWLAKLADTENKLQLKTQELNHARNTIDTLEAKGSADGRIIDRQLQEYMDQNNDLKLQILKKEGEIDNKSCLIKTLQSQLDSEMGVLKSYEREKEEQSKTLELFKDTLKEQEEMLEEQSELISNKEAELQSSELEIRELRKQYQTLLENKDSSLEDTKAVVRLEIENSMLKQQVTDSEVKLSSLIEEKDKLSGTVKECKTRVTELEKKLKKADNEREKLTAVLRENNDELKAMECSITEARREIEDLRSHGAQKFSQIHIEEFKREHENTLQELHHKVRELQCQNKEINFKLRAGEQNIVKLTEEKHILEQRLQEFREERDKLVSGLEAVMKKKDMEIKQLKDMIKQMKEKEIQITKSWHDEREKIATGLQELNQQSGVKVKHETVTPGSPTTDQPRVRDTSETPVCRHSPFRQSSRGRPVRPVDPPRIPNADTIVTESDVPETPDLKNTEIQTLERSPGSSRRNSRVTKDTPGSANQESGRSKRSSSRRGKKRPSSECLENLPPLPKRHSKDSVVVSESDDYSTHIQVDATPPVAAKTLRKTRKRNGSVQDLSKQNDENEEEKPQRPQRASKRTAKHRLLESFRESPMGRTSKRILDSIAETFSPKSPTKSPTKSPVKSPLREDNSMDKGGNKSRRGRHKLYSEDTYISEPMENTGDFVQSPTDVHQTVTRSLRSRRH